MTHFLFEKKQQLLLTYDPHWDSVHIPDVTSVVKAVVADIVHQTDRAHTRYVLASNVEMCAKLSDEIITEIVNFVVMVGSCDVKDSSKDEGRKADSHAESISDFVAFNKVDVICSQEAPPRNLAVDLEDGVPGTISHDQASFLPDQTLQLAHDPTPSTEPGAGDEVSIQAADQVHEALRDDAADMPNDADPSFCVDAQKPTDATSAEFEELWTKRKLDVEKSAEGRARVVFRQWQRDRVTLTQAIDESLREYADMYEKAHALRLMFEEEKSQWSRQVMLVHAEDTPHGYGGDFKRRRCDAEWAPPQPAWPYPQRQSLDSEFQYTVDESQDTDYLTANTANGMSCRDTSRGVDVNNITSPQKKLYKKFTVPVKIAQET